MAEFSHRLEQIAQNCGGQSKLADQCDIDRSIISRLISGKSRMPDFETLGKFCRHLDPPNATILLRAWISDNFPDDLAAYITIQDQFGSRIREEFDPSNCTNAQLEKLSHSTRETIIHLIEMSLSDKDFAKMLDLVTRQWDPEWAKARSAALMRSVIFPE